MSEPSLRVGQLFDSFKDAEKVIVEFCEEKYHPIRVDRKESIRTANKKVSEK